MAVSSNFLNEFVLFQLNWPFLLPAHAETEEQGLAQRMVGRSDLDGTGSL